MVDNADDGDALRSAGLDLDPGVAPASERVLQALRAAIDDRMLLPGDRLPTVRALASQQGLAPNTVAKAYRALERDGYVIARGRAGTYVAATPPGAAEINERALAEAADRFARAARGLGAGPGATVEALRIALASPDRRA